MSFKLNSNGFIIIYYSTLFLLLFPSLPFSFTWITSFSSFCSSFGSFICHLCLYSTRSSIIIRKISYVKLQCCWQNSFSGWMQKKTLRSKLAEHLRGVHSITVSDFSSFWLAISWERRKIDADFSRFLCFFYFRFFVGGEWSLWIKFQELTFNCSTKSKIYVKTTTKFSI